MACTFTHRGWRVAFWLSSPGRYEYVAVYGFDRWKDRHGAIEASSEEDARNKILLALKEAS